MSRTRHPKRAAGEEAGGALTQVLCPPVHLGGTMKQREAGSNAVPHWLCYKLFEALKITRSLIYFVELWRSSRSSRSSHPTTAGNISTVSSSSLPSSSSSPQSSANSSGCFFPFQVGDFMAVVPAGGSTHGLCSAQWETSALVLHSCDAP